MLIENNLDNLISSNEAIAVYFSTEYCNVCKVLKPKVKELLENDFPNIKFVYVDIEKQKEVSGKYSIFTVPTLVFFFNGKESFRKSRNFSLAELYQAIERPYSFLFS